MSPILTLVLSVVLVISSWILTGTVLRYALASHLLDVPNARSSHRVATPRGGGLSIVVLTLLALPLLGSVGAMSWHSVVGLAGSGAIVAAIGFADDHRDVAARWRLVAHFVAAGWLMAWLERAPPISVLGFQLIGWISVIFALLYLVWVTNLFNFMDGIDGLAGAEAVTVCIGAGVIAVMVFPSGGTWLAPLALGSATLGFLPWNWPPAKIFMGDVGAGFLGTVLAGLSLVASLAEPRLLWSWIILLGVFVVDATVTLLRRVARRERFFEAHRSHAYQHAALKCQSHLPVTVAVAAINLCWLLPIALLVGRGRVDGVVGVLLAYGPLVIGTIVLRAGETATARVA